MQKREFAKTKADLHLPRYAVVAKNRQRDQGIRRMNPAIRVIYWFGLDFGSLVVMVSLGSSH